MTVDDMLAAADVTRLAAPDKTAMLRALARHAAGRLGIDEAALGRALVAREALGSTAIGNGIALPHARIDAVRHPFGFFAVLDRPIEFGALDDRPVDLVFLLLLPAQGPEDALRCLACVARRMKDPGLPDRIRAETDPAQIYAFLVGD